MKLIELTKSNSILNNYISEIRDMSVQKDSMRFRTNLQRIGQVFAYEISKELNYAEREIITPLGIAKSNIMEDQLIISTILRAGLPLHEGILSFFDKAQNSFIAAYRKYGKDNKFDIQIEYLTSPNLDGKTLILADTMLATGYSIKLAAERLKEYGTPNQIHIVCPIASSYGVEYVMKNFPFSNTVLWVGAVDEELTNKSYIVPGLGDAGDLAFGSKL